MRSRVESAGGAFGLGSPVDPLQGQRSMVCRS